MRLAIGESVLVFVVQPENQEGQAVVSIDRARQEKSWRKLQEIYEANDVIEAEVTSTLSAAAGADPAEIRRTVAERYAEFLARRG